MRSQHSECDPLRGEPGNWARTTHCSGANCSLVQEHNYLTNIHVFGVGNKNTFQKYMTRVQCSLWGKRANYTRVKKTETWSRLHTIQMRSQAVRSRTSNSMISTAKWIILPAYCSPSQTTLCLPPSDKRLLGSSVACLCDSRPSLVSLINPCHI